MPKQTQLIPFESRTLNISFLKIANFKVQAPIRIDTCLDYNTKWASMCHLRAPFSFSSEIYKIKSIATFSRYQIMEDSDDASLMQYRETRMQYRLNLNTVKVAYNRRWYTITHKTEMSGCPNRIRLTAAGLISLREICANITH